MDHISHTQNLEGSPKIKVSFIILIYKAEAYPPAWIVTVGIKMGAPARASDQIDRCHVTGNIPAAHLQTTLVLGGV